MRLLEDAFVQGVLLEFKLHPMNNISFACLVSELT